MGKIKVYGHMHQHRYSVWERIKMFFGWKNKRFIITGNYIEETEYMKANKLPS